MFLVAAGFFYGAYYLYGQWKASQETETSTSKGTDWDEVTASSSSFTPSSDLMEQNLDNIAEPADWRYYRNVDYGFALNVPQNVLGTDYCLERKFEVPVVTLKDSDSHAVFVVPEYFYEKYTPSNEELRDKSGDITFEEDDPIDEGDPNLSDTDGDGINDCRKRYYSISLIRLEIKGTDRGVGIPPLGNPKLGIALRSVKIEDTARLNNFLAETFGSGCVLSGKTELEGREGLYKLKIANTEGTDKRGNKLVCATTKVTDILYNPSHNRLVYALLPKEGMLFSDEGGIYDEDMIASMHLE